MFYLFFLVITITVVIVLSRAFNQRFPSLAGKKFDIFSPFFFFPLMYLLIYCLGAMAWPGFEEVGGVALPVLVGMVAYYVGVLFACSMTINKTRYVVNVTSELIVLVGLFLFFTMFALYIFMRVGVPLLMPDVENARTSLVQEVGGVIFYMYRSLPLVAVLLFTYYLVHGGATGRFARIMMITSLIVVVLSAYRGHLVAPILTMLIVYHYLKRSLSFKELALLLAGGLILFSFFGVLRLSSTDSDNVNFLYRLVVELRNPSRALELVMANYPESFPFYDGKIITNAFSVLFTDTPAYGIFLKEELGLYFQGGGFTPSILGSFYLDMGYLSIFTGMAAVGFLLTILYRRMNSSNSYHDVVLYAFVCQYMVICIRGGFFQEILPLWYVILLLCIKHATSQVVHGRQGRKFLNG